MQKHIAPCIIAATVLITAVHSHAEEWVELLDPQLSNFEIWMGVPHSSVKGLPEGTYQSDKVTKGTPLGLNADIKKVFTVEMTDGEPVLHISGEIYGGLTSLKEYENYHLSLQMKWGEKKWAPRLNQLRDSGILYHCHGEHGSFWGVWKSSLECQVQETDLGDFIPLAGPRAQVRITPTSNPKRPRFDPASSEYGNGYISAYPEPDSPHGEWNRMDLYVVGDSAFHVVNGQVVMITEKAQKKDGTPLVRGQIQIQSEAAEVFYKDIKICPITEFPAELIKQLPASWAPLK